MAKKTASRNVFPDLAILLACDSAARDPNSGKTTLYGVFDRINTPQLPAKTKFSIFAKFREGKGNHEISLEFVDAKGRKIDKNVPIFTITCQPNGVYELMIQVIGLEIKTTGPHYLQFRSKGQVVGKPYRIDVREAPALAGASS